MNEWKVMRAVAMAAVLITLIGIIVSTVVARAFRLCRCLGAGSRSRLTECRGWQPSLEPWRRKMNPEFLPQRKIKNISCSLREVILRRLRTFFNMNGQGSIESAPAPQSQLFLEKPRIKGKEGPLIEKSRKTLINGGINSENSVEGVHFFTFLDDPAPRNDIAHNLNNIIKNQIYESILDVPLETNLDLLKVLITAREQGSTAKFTFEMGSLFPTEPGPPRFEGNLPRIRIFVLAHLIENPTTIRAPYDPGGMPKSPAHPRVPSGSDLESCTALEFEEALGGRKIRSIKISVSQVVRDSQHCGYQEFDLVIPSQTPGPNMIPAKPGKTLIHDVLTSLSLWVVQIIHAQVHTINSSSAPCSISSAHISLSISSSPHHLVIDSHTRTTSALMQPISVPIVTLPSATLNVSEIQTFSNPTRVSLLHPGFHCASVQMDNRVIPLHLHPRRYKSMKPRTTETGLSLN